MNRHELTLMGQVLLERHGLDPLLAPALGEALSSATLSELRDGEVLCHEGGMGTEMWILLRGKVRVFKRDYQGKERKLATLQPPSLLGHMAMVDANRRSATCRIVGDALLAVLDKGRFQSLMRDLSPPGDVFRRLLITSMWQQLASGNARLSELMSPGFKEHATEEMTSGDLVDAVSVFEGWR